MSDLKTLKDIVRIDIIDNTIREDELRQEAIKWIKYAEERTGSKIKNITVANGLNIVHWEGEAVNFMMVGMVTGFVDFFNITDEDLLK